MDVYPIVQALGCTGAACHGGARPASNLDLSTASTGYKQLVNVPADECSSKTRVVPGSSSTSYLMAKLTGVGMCSGSLMPKGGGLSSAQIDTFRTWMDSGANP